MIKNITLILIIASIFSQGFSTLVILSPGSPCGIALPPIFVVIPQGKPDKDVITITQTMPSSVIAGTEFTVELTITKGSITSFAKVQQELPPGFTATAIEIQQANFSFNNQIVKFIWKSLPEESEFQLSYKVAVRADEVSGIKSIGGIFAYLENNERRVVDIPPNDILIRGSVEASVESAYIVSSSETTEEIIRNSESSTSGIPTEYTGGIETIPPEVGKETTESTEPTTPSTRDETLVHEDAYGEEIGKAVEELTEFADKTAETSTSPSPIPTKGREEPTLEKSSKPAPTYISPPAKRSIEYRVQIAAAYKKISTTHFLNKYNITERINHEVHNEMNKYTVGSFSNYRSAIEHVNFIRNNKGVEGAFITAYENGKRVTVRDAFEISKQDWNR